MKYLYIILSVFTLTSISAQNVSDAVRYSNYDPIGTAGAVGVGTSLGALGGDFSVISINPAGIAEYRKSVFTFTPSINSSSSNAYFVDDNNVANRTRSSFLIDNIGFVSSSGSLSQYGKVTSNWAIGFSKLTEFGRDIKIQGATEGNITERFLELARGKELDDLDAFGAGVAYDAQAIFQDEDGNYLSDYRTEDVVNKDQFIDERGSINELSFGWAANYGNKFNIGISAGIPFLNYSSIKTYNESLVDGDFSNNLTYIENLSTTGTGFNMKLGVQYKALPQLRVGAAIHSPSWFTLNDDFSTSMQYEYSTANESGSGSSESPDGAFKYSYTSPWKAVGSLASIYKFGEIKGFVNADIEYVDYQNNEFDFTSHSDDPAEASFTQEVNGEIDDELGSATNIRLGTELAYSDVRLRAGYTISSSPFTTQDDANTSWSAGVGFRGTGFFVDLGYRRRSTAEGYNPYVVETEQGRDPLANINTDFGKIVATIGFQF